MRTIFLFLLALASGTASASVTVYKCQGDAQCTLWRNAPEAACQDWVDILEASGPDSSFSLNGVQSLPQPGVPGICSIHQTNYDTYGNVTYSGNTTRNFQQGTQCTDPEIWDEGSQSCVQPSTCTQGETRTLRGDSGGLPAEACLQGCTYKPTAGGVGVELVSGYWAGSFVADGSSCTANDDNKQTNNDCIADAQGNELCAKPTQQNCGTFNGQTVCLDSLPPTGQCTIIAGKGYICDAGAAPPTLPDGQQAPKVGDITGEDPGQPGTGAMHLGIYDNGVVGDTPSQPGLPSDQQTDEPLKIDESGVPEGTDNMFDQKISDAVDQFASGIGTDHGVGSGSGSINWDPGLPASASCVSLTLSFANRTFTFPGADGCAMLQTWKDIAGWALYILTGIAIFEIATRRPA